MDKTNHRIDDAVSELVRTWTANPLHVGSNPSRVFGGKMDDVIVTLTLNDILGLVVCSGLVICAAGYSIWSVVRSFWNSF